ncbi:MAG: sigma-E processing peptidase SpoIIGA [Eubacteriales bacterium]
MYYVIGEKVLVENFIINLIILILTSKVMRKNNIIKRLVFASFIGALYSILQFEYEILFFFLLKIILSILILFIAFYPFSFKEFVKAMIIFYTVSAALGGCVFVIFLMLHGGNGFNIELQGVSSYLIIMGILMGITVIVKFKEYIIDNKLNDEDLIQIEICIDSKVITLNGFRDTGCSLKDPFTGKPILLVTFDILQSVLPKDVVTYLKAYNHTYDTNIQEKIKDINHIAKIHFIPFHTVQNDSQYLFCYLVDYVEFIVGNNKLRINKVYVSISKSNISQNNEFQALINPKLLFI